MIIIIKIIDMVVVGDVTYTCQDIITHVVIIFYDMMLSIE